MLLFLFSFPLLLSKYLFNKLKLGEKIQEKKPNEDQILLAHGNFHILKFHGFGNTPNTPVEKWDLRDQRCGKDRS